MSIDHKFDRFESAKSSDTQTDGDRPIQPATRRALSTAEYQTRAIVASIN